MSTKPFAYAVLLAMPAMAAAGELGADTLAAWNRYVAAADANMKARLQGTVPFLAVDENPALARKLRQNEIVVRPGDDHSPLRVPAGLIHHWIAAAFIPETNGAEVVRALREYDRYSQYYAPAVIESKSLGEAGDDDRFRMRVINSAVLSKVALDADFKSTTVMDGARGYKTMCATRVQQIEDFGQSDQHMLPEDQGTGLVWRLYSIARFEERDGGVYLELDSMALSRDIPASLQWMVSPMIRRVAKNALSGMLQKTRDAILESAEVARRDSTHMSSEAGCRPRVNCLH